MILKNEFAMVEIEPDHSANGVRLKIRSIRTGWVAYLDPVQLEVLTWIPAEHLMSYMETPFGPEELNSQPESLIHEPTS